MVSLKKGQVEIVGLVIIVLLIVSISILFLYFKAGQQDTAVDDREMELRANQLRSSLLQTTLCEDVNVKEELIACSSGFSLCSSCEESHDVVKNIIELSLDERIGYEFNLDPDLSFTRGNCYEKIAAAEQPLSQNVKVSLSLCFL